MLDTLIQRVKEEVAIDGETGSNINDVWEYVQTVLKETATQSNTSITPLVDERYKQFIWKYLVVESDLSFYESTHDVTMNQDTTQPEAEANTLDDSIEPIAKEQTNASTTEQQQSDREEEDALANKKRKRPPPKNKKKKATAKKPKKKPKKKVAAGDSDDDFVDDDMSESSSESEFDEVASSEEEDGEEDVEQLLRKNTPMGQKRNNSYQKSHPKTIEADQQFRINKHDLILIQNIQQFSYQEVVEKYGNRLFVIASDKLQEEQLLIDVPPGNILSSNLLQVLKEILKTRKKGLYQANITKLLQLDSRSTGHYVKSLEEKGAITRSGVSINSMYTNICVHVRFHAEKTKLDMNTVGDDKESNQIPYNVNAFGKVYSQQMVLESFVEFAQGAPNNIVIARDVLHALGFDSTKKQVQKWFNRVIDEICMKGYFKKHNVLLEDKGRRFRGLELLKEPITDKSAARVLNSVDTISLPIRIESSQKDIPVIHLLWDLSVEAQCLQVITAAGENGATQKDISFALNIDEPRVMNKALEHLLEPKVHVNDRYRVVRFLEFDRRLKRYRYYTLAAHLKLTENRDLPPQHLPDPGLDVSKCYERNIFYDAPHDSANFGKFLSLYVKARSSKATELNALNAPAEHNGFKIKSTPASKKKGRPLKSAVNKDENQSAATRPSVSVVPTEEGHQVDPSFANDSVAVTKKKRGRQSSTSKAIEKNNQSSTKKPRKSTHQTPLQIEDQVEVQQQVKLASPTEESMATRSVKKRKTIQQEKLSDTTSANQSEPVCSSEPEMQAMTPVEPVIAIESPVQSVITDPVLPEPSVAVAEPLIVIESVVTEPNKTASSNSQRESTPSNQISAKGPAKKKTLIDYFTRVSKKSPSTAESTPTPVAVQVSAPKAPNSEDPTISSIPSGDKEIAEVNREIEQDATRPTEQPTVELMDVCEPLSTEVEPLNSDLATITNDISPSHEQVEPSAGEPSAGEHSAGESFIANALNTQPLPEASSQTTVSENINVDAMDTTNETNPQEAKPRSFPNRLISFRHQVRQSRNPYAAARMKALVMLLSERRITEFDKSFRDDYLKCIETLNVSHNGTICNKTIWKTALEAHEQGLAKTNIVTITLLSGATIERKTIAHADVDLDGEEYQNFAKLLKDRKVLTTSQYGFNKLENTNVSVERLNVRLARMQEEASSEQDVIKAKLMEERILELSKNLDTFSQKKQDSAPVAWMISAIQFGWIQAIMIRAKILHELVVRLLETNTEGVFPEERLVNATTIIKNLSIGNFCQVIGLNQPSEELIAFVKDPDNVGLVFDELPKSLKAELFGEPNKFRRRLRVIFQVLQYIGAITPVFPSGTRRQSKSALVEYAPQYKVEPAIEIKDRRILDQPIRYVKQINSVEDVESFFKDLQYVCINASAQPTSDDVLAPLPTDPLQLQLFRTIHNRNNWSTSSIFSAEKRKHINTYIDKKNYTTPLDNTSLMRQISREADCPIYVLTMYYQKAQTLLNQKKLTTELQYVMSHSRVPNKRVKRGKKVDIFEGRRVIKKDSAHAFVSRKYDRQVNVLPHVDMETVRSHNEESERFSDRQAKGELLFMDDIESLPVLPSDDTASCLRKKRNKRVAWSRQDDELLLYGNVVLRQRTGRQRYSWVPIVKHLFPEKGTPSCRHRYTKLMRMAEWRELFETHTYKWNNIYNEGIQNGDIEDNDPEDNINCDLLGLVTYFIQKLSEDSLENRPSDARLLPKNLQDFHANFEIVNRVSKASTYLQDAFHESHTMARKSQILYSQTFTLKKYDSKRLDQSEAAIKEDIDKTSRSRKICRSFALMCLMTPAESYDPFYCYSVLQQFPKKLLDSVTQTMREEGTLVLTSQDRPIPGTRLSLSEKFMRCMAGRLPKDMFQQAKEYEKFLRQQNEAIRFTSDHASSGMIACLLNLFSDNKLSIVPVNLDRQLRSMSEGNIHTRSVDVSLVRFDINVEIADKEDQITPYVPLLNQPQLKLLDSSAFNAEFDKLLESQDVGFDELLRQVMCLLYEQEEAGLTLYQLKSKVDSIYSDENVMHAVHVLCTNEPMLICRVGFEAVRYVHILFAKGWTVSTNVSEYDISNAEVREAIQEASKKIDVSERKDLIVPSIWTDVNGSTTDIVLRDCKEFLVDLILTKPGITEADIHRQAEMALSKRELRDVLSMLVEQQVLRQTCLRFSPNLMKKPSVFGKSRTISCKNNNSIEGATQSCFWVTSKPYTFLN